MEVLKSTMLRFYVKWLLLIPGIMTGILVSGQPLTRTTPNIIFIYADDLGYNEIGAYGQKKILTPNLDRMAKEGMRFTQFYTGSPVCAPARSILLTGRHAGHSYIRGNYELGGFADDEEGGQMPLPEGTFTIGHMLKKKGYVTGAIGKWGLGVYGTSGSPDKQGFDYFYGYLDQKQAHNHYPTHLWENGKWDSLGNEFITVHQTLKEEETDPASYQRFRGKTFAADRMIPKTRAFIQKNKRKPFFLYLPYTFPHLSLQAPQQAVDKYRGMWEEKPYRGEKGYASTLYPRSTYAAMVSYLDSMVGLVFSALRQEGLDGNTIVLFSSDNGGTFDVGGFERAFFESNAPFRGGKQDLYEGGIRVPLIAWWPGRIKAGSVNESVAVQTDMMATFADLTGAAKPVTDGISIVPQLTGKGKPVFREYLYFEFPEKGGQVAVRLGKWKAVKTNMRKDPFAKWELYDLSADISETRDISANHATLIRRFDEIVRKEHQHAHVREWEFIDPRFKIQ